MNLIPSEKNQLEHTLEVQRAWYHKNKEKVSKKKKEWYEKNKEKVRAMNKEWRELQRIEKEKEKAKEQETAGKFKKTCNLYQVLDVLRKSPRHYLWGKSVKQWTEKDWESFNQINIQNT
jgi:hypothetical protein